MSEDELVSISIRLPKALDQRLSFLAFKNEEKSGFRLSKTAIIRTLLEEALNTRGIPRDPTKYQPTNKTG